MKHLLSSLLVFAVVSSLSVLANAQQAKVIKVKGQQAIVQFPNGVPPVVGEMIPVGGEAQTETGGHTARGSRAHLLTVGADLSFLNNSVTSLSETRLALQGRYGWNQEILEFGPLAQISYASTTGISSRSILGGGFVDFNFVPNRPGTPLTYGVGAFADVGQEGSTVASVDSSYTRYDLFLGGNLKWFGLSDNVALRADAGFYLSHTSPNSQSTNLTGFKVLGALAFYF